MNFAEKFQSITEKNNSLLCVGLDPDFEKGSSIFNFNKQIIDKTNNLVCAYKPNIAFYEAQGTDGLRELKKTINYLKKNFPQIPIILDAKRADVPNTAKMYSRAAFEYWDADAVTVYPYLGLDSIEPFLKYRNKHTILILKTSNEDSKTFQNIKTGSDPYYLKLARIVKSWKKENIGIFAGATYPDELKQLRKIFPNKIFLSAGIGAQKADIKKAVKAGIAKNGSGIIFSISRSIIYSKNLQEATLNFRDEINSYRKNKKNG